MFVTLTYNRSETVPTAAGSNYAVVGTVDDANYDGSATGTLVIAPRPITVTADAKTKVYGTADPALTYQITAGSLVGGDSLTGSLTRTSGESVAGGPDAIEPGTLSAGSYYTISYNGSFLTITKASAGVTLSNLSQTYDGLPKTPTVITTPAGLNVSFTYNGSSTAPTAAGSYAVIGTVMDENYEGGTSGTLLIAPRNITVTAIGVDKVYDGTTTATVILSDDRITGDSLIDSYTDAAFSDKRVGDNNTVTVTGISISGADAGNYTLTSTTATTTASILRR